MDHCAVRAIELPDIEIYGGDTQPWSISPTKANGTHYTLDELEEYNCVLTISPFSASAFNPSSRPIITKDGRMGEDENGGATVTFEFNKSDTMAIGGKFIYQIAFTIGDQKARVGQGKLVIKPNNNRGA